MSPPLPRRTTLHLASLVVTGSLAGCQGITLSRDPPNSNGGKTVEGDDSPGLAYSESSGPFRGGEEAHSGWVHIVGDGRSADLTFDARFCTALGVIEPTLRRSVPGEYVLGFETSNDVGDETSVQPSDGERPCTSGTRIVGGANVPNDWRTLVVSVDGVELETIERSGTTPELRPLPDPISGFE